MSIGSRLTVTFAAMIALTLAVGAQGLTQIRRLNDTTRIADERFAKVRLAQQGVQRINENARIALHLFLVSDPGAFARQVTRQRETSDEITELYKTFEKQVDTDDERVLFAKVKEARAHYVAVRAHAEALLQAGRRSEAQSLIDDTVLPALDDYIATWNMLLDLEGRRVGDTAREAASGYARARFVAGGLAGLAAMIGALVAGLVTRRITRPIVEMARTVRRLERGDEAPRMLVTTNDEVGALAQAFNRMGEAVTSRQASEVQTSRRVWAATNSSFCSTTPLRLPSSLSAYEYGNSSWRTRLRLGEQGRSRSASEARSTRGITQAALQSFWRRPTDGCTRRSASGGVGAVGAAFTRPCSRFRRRPNMSHERFFGDRPISATPMAGPARSRSAQR
jgi:HAMP domain-containing protein